MESDAFMNSVKRQVEFTCSWRGGSRVGGGAGGEVAGGCGLQHALALLLLLLQPCLCFRPGFLQLLRGRQVGSSQVL